MATPEAAVKKLVKKALDALPCPHYRFLPVQTGFGAKTLDFLISVAGRFVAIETKAPGKKPTPLQEFTIEQIKAAGGLVFVVDGKERLDEAMVVLRKLCGY